MLTAAEAVSKPGEVPIVFLVADVAGDWLQVHLPVRPNGSTRLVEEIGLPLGTPVEIVA